MVKIENIQVFNLEGAIRGMRFPMQSWEKSDSYYNDFHFGSSSWSEYVIGPNDLALAQKLIKAGESHSKFMRQILVSMDITAPRYWWTQMETYKVGTTSNSESFMHRGVARPFRLSDFSIEAIMSLEPQKPEYHEVNTIIPKEREIFVPIVGYSNYSISNTGRIIRHEYSIVDKNGRQRTYKENELTPSVNSSNYKKVILRANGEVKNHYLHRLLAEHFIPNPENKPQINHIDGNKWNNNLDNLEWVTASENALHASKLGLKKVSGYNKYKIREVNRRFSPQEIKEFFRLYEEGLTKKEIAKLFNCADSIVGDIINGKSYKELELTPLDLFRIIVDQLNMLRELYLEEQDEEKKQKIWESIIRILPQSYNQKRHWTGSYANLLNMGVSRQNHKLREWSEFINTLKQELPYYEQFLEVLNER